VRVCAVSGSIQTDQSAGQSFRTLPHGRYGGALHRQTISTGLGGDNIHIDMSIIYHTVRDNPVYGPNLFITLDSFSYRVTHNDSIVIRNISVTYGVSRNTQTINPASKSMAQSVTVLFVPDLQSSRTVVGMHLRIQFTENGHPRTVDIANEVYVQQVAIDGTQFSENPPEIPDLLTILHEALKRPVRD